MAASRPLSAWLLVPILAIGLWPHVYVLPLGPESRDAVIWITRGLLGARNWADWVFASDHFIGYRPVTALSYTLGTLSGPTPTWPLRVTDLGLHAACAGLLYAVYRRLVPSLPAWGGLAASAFFLLHPVTALVVPHLARRGYSLATFFSLLGLLSISRPWLAAALIGLAALSNEAAYVVFPVAAALAWLARAPPRALAPLFAVPVGLVALRFAVLGGAGGYDVERGARWLPIVSSTWEGLLGFEVLRSEVPPVPDALAVAVVTAVVAGLGVPVLLYGTREARLASGVLWAWVAGLTLVYAPQGVFFPRQLYVPLAPVALLVGVAVAEGAVANGARRIALLGAAAIALLAVARQSPVLRGPDPIQFAAWRAHDRLLRDLDRDLSALPDGAVVHPVIPYHRRPSLESLRAREPEERSGGRQALLWLEKVRRVDFGEHVLVVADARTPPPYARLEEQAGQWVVLLAPGTEASASTGGDTRIDGAVVRPDSTAEGGRRAFLYFHDGVAGRLIGLRPEE